MKSAIALAYDYSTFFEIGRIRKEEALRSVEVLLERTRLVVLPLGRGGGLGKFASLLLECVASSRMRHFPRQRGSMVEEGTWTKGERSR